MNKHRNAEEGSIPFRTGRFFNIDTNWYFACRGETNAGPYDSKPEATLMLYIRDLNTFNERIGSK